MQKNNDRELLELAAKAAGIVGEYKETHQAYGDAWVAGIDTGGRFWWNPLEDGGDALQLAVKLRMDIYLEESSVMVVAEESERVTRTLDGALTADKATRKAIVECAASIGRNMP